MLAQLAQLAQPKTPGLLVRQAISEGAASPGKRAGDLLVDALVDSSGRRKLSSSVLLNLITKLSHVGSTGLSRLNQDWAGPYFLGQRVFRWAHWKAEIVRRVVCAHSLDCGSLMPGSLYPCWFSH